MRTNYILSTAWPRCIGQIRIHFATTTSRRCNYNVWRIKNGLIHAVFHLLPQFSSSLWRVRLPGCLQKHCIAVVSSHVCYPSFWRIRWCFQIHYGSWKFWTTWSLPFPDDKLRQPQSLEEIHSQKAFLKPIISSILLHACHCRGSFDSSRKECSNLSEKRILLPIKPSNSTLDLQPRCRPIHLYCLLLCCTRFHTVMATHVAEIFFVAGATWRLLDCSNKSGKGMKENRTRERRGLVTCTALAHTNATSSSSLFHH